MTIPHIQSDPETNKIWVPVDAELVERLVVHLRAQRAQMFGPSGESPPKWFGETELRGWVEQLETALRLTGKGPV